MGKWSLIDLYVLVMSMISFYVDIYSPKIQILPTNFYLFSLWVTPQWGLYAFCFAVTSSLLISHVRDLCVDVCRLHPLRNFQCRSQLPKDRLTLGIALIHLFFDLFKFCFDLIAVQVQIVAHRNAVASDRQEHSEARQAQLGPVGMEEDAGEEEGETEGKADPQDNRSGRRSPEEQFVRLRTTATTAPRAPKKKSRGRRRSSWFDAGTMDLPTLRKPLVVATESVWNHVFHVREFVCGCCVTDVTDVWLTFLNNSCLNFLVAGGTLRTRIKIGV